MAASHATPGWTVGAASRCSIESQLCCTSCTLASKAQTTYVEVGDTEARAMKVSHMCYSLRTVVLGKHSQPWRGVSQARPAEPCSLVLPGLTSQAARRARIRLRLQFWKTNIRHVSLGINNSFHVDFTDLSSFVMFYNSKFIHLVLLPQSILSHGRFTAQQTPSAYSKWNVKLSDCRMVSAPYVRNTSTQSNLLFKLMRN